MKKNRLFCLIALMLWMFSSNPCFALSLPNNNRTESAALIRNIGKPIKLETVRFEHIKNNQENILSKTHLMQASIRLRDIARYLSSNSPINLSVYSIDMDSSETSQKESYQITDIKTIDGNWNTLTAGHALRLVTEEIAVIQNQQQQPIIDLLATNSQKQVYHPLIGIPLNHICSAILKQLLIK